MNTVRVGTLMSSPLGDLWAEATERGLSRLTFDVPPGAGVVDHPLFRALASQLDEYWAGQRRTFSLPLDLRGSPFQQRVWTGLLNIPWGKTRTYADQARALGADLAIRAVAAANGRNPVVIVVPCHRVIGSDGGLTGYSGGLERKRALLEREGWKDPSAGQEVFFFHQAANPV